jgi:hypothetical protein
MADYPDFTTAWADWNGWIKDDVNASWAFSDIELGNAYLAGFTATGFNYALNAISQCLYMIFSHAMQGDGLYDNDAHDAVVWKAWQEGGATSMASINAAMFEGEYQEIIDFVGLNWAYQQIVWDQPFFPAKYTEIINRVRT